MLSSAQSAVDLQVRAESEITVVSAGAARFGARDFGKDFSVVTLLREISVRDELRAVSVIADQNVVHVGTARNELSVPT